MNEISNPFTGKNKKSYTILVIFYVQLTGQRVNILLQCFGNYLNCKMNKI